MTAAPGRTEYSFIGAAVPYAERGLPVFPVSPKTKRPYKGTHGFKDATTDADRISRWGKRYPKANVAVSCGGARWLVLDVDPRHGGQESLDRFVGEHGLLPKTVCAKTGGGGQHYVFTNTDGIKSGKLPGYPGLDVKAIGGYVVVAPSIHASGDRYEWHISLDDADPADPPPALIGLLNGSAREEHDDDGAVLADLLGHPAPKGGRNEWLTRVAGHYARCFDRLHDYEIHVLSASQLTDPPMDLREAKTVARSIWSREGRRFERQVEQRKFAISVTEEARRQLRAETAGDRFDLPKAGWTLKDELERPTEECVYRIEGMQTIGGNVLLVASYKAGKTVVTMNLARALADGEAFLGKFGVEPIAGRIAVFNYEITREMWNRWAAEMEIANPDRIVVAHLRGAGITPIWAAGYQDRVVEWMAQNEVKYWISDPTAMAWRGLIEGEGDNVGAGEFTAAIDAIKQRAEIPEALLTHHTGRYEQREDEERARGATRLEDWMDAGWYLTKDTAQRFVRASGRDVDQEPLALSYDRKTRRVSATGLTKEEARDQRGAEAVVDAMVKLAESGEERPATETVKQAMQGDHNKKGAAIGAAERGRLIKREQDGRKKACVLTQMGRRSYEKRHR